VRFRCRNSRLHGRDSVSATGVTMANQSASVRLRRGQRAIERGHVFDGGKLAIPKIGERAVRIYLPPGYDRSNRHHPVAYLFDGQNVFADEGSFAGGWRMHLVLDRLAQRGQIVPIVVGIHHGGADRLGELSPWDTSGRTGKADALVDWMATDLHRRVKESFRILDGPAHTHVGGSSMGGLTALYTLFRRPEVFGRALCMSPALWVASGRIFSVISSTALPWTCRVYIDAGGHERGMAHAAREMSHLLTRKGLVPGKQLHWRYDPRGHHAERSWRRRLPAALRFLLR
jgi:predicted alpha/beta superfamily hydrolase